MRCKRIQKFLWLYPDGGLTLKQRAAVERHLEGCPTCRRQLEGWSVLQGELSSPLHLVPSPDFDERVLRAAQARCASRSQRRGHGVGLAWGWTLSAGARLAQMAWSKLILALCAVTVLSVPAFREMAGFHFGMAARGSLERNEGNELDSWPSILRWPPASPEQFRQLAEAVGNDPVLWQAAAEVASSVEEAVALYDRAIALEPQNVSLYAGQAIAALPSLDITIGTAGPSREKKGEMVWALNFKLDVRILRKILDRLGVARQLDPDNAFLDYLLAYFQLGVWPEGLQQMRNPRILQAPGTPKPATAPVAVIASGHVQGRMSPDVPRTGLWFLRRAGLKPRFETYRTQAAQALVAAYQRLGYPVLESQWLSLGAIKRPELAKLRSLAWRALDFSVRAKGRGEHELALIGFEGVLHLGAHLCRSHSSLDLLVGGAVQSLGLGGPVMVRQEPNLEKYGYVWGNVSRYQVLERLPTFQRYARKHGRADLAAWAEREVWRNLERWDRVQQALSSGCFGPSVDPHLVRVGVGELAAGVAALGLAGLLLTWLLAALPWGKEEAPGLPWRSWHWLALWGPMVLLPFGLIVALAGWIPVTGWLSCFPEQPTHYLRWAQLALTLFLLGAFEVGVGLRLLRARRAGGVSGAMAGRTFASAARATCALLAVLYLGALAFTVQARQDASTALGRLIQQEIPTLLEHGERNP